MRLFLTGTEAARFLRTDYRGFKRLIDRREVEPFGYLVTEQNQHPIFEYAAITALQSRNTESETDEE